MLIRLWIRYYGYLNEVYTADTNFLYLLTTYLYTNGAHQVRYDASSVNFKKTAHLFHGIHCMLVIDEIKFG